MKLRQLGENLVASFSQHFQIPRNPRSSFLDYLSSDIFKNSVPNVVLNKFHAVRTQGNRAAHGTGPVNPQNSMWILRETFDLSRWFVLTLQTDAEVEALQFQEPPQAEADSKGKIQREKKAALQKLAAQEAQMQKLLEELEAARAQIAGAEKSAEDERRILAQTSQAVDVLQFDEAKTRQLLIDQMLSQAGWSVGSGLASTEEVGKGG